MNTRKSESYWYWDDTADDAIYARLLIRSNDRQKAETLISDMLKGVNIESYFVSTQSKIQIFLGLIELSSGHDSLRAFQLDTGTLKIDVKPTPKTHRYTYTTRRSLLGKTLDIHNLE